MPKTYLSHQRIFSTLLILFMANLASCTPADANPARPTEPAIQASAQPTPEPSSTPTQIENEEVVPDPESFESRLLRSGVSPISYIDDQCEYLGARWDPENSTPWTVVATIMYHSIRPSGEPITDPSAVSEETFYATVELAQELGFETITTEELIAFLKENAPIPERSIIFVLDDRKPGTAEKYFLPINEENGWTTTLAWPIGDTDIRTGLWEWIERVNETGYFDVQSHGLNHIYLTDRTNEEDTREEIFGSIPILEQHFGQRPSAYVWPGGNYTALGIEIAQEAGFEVGFTVEARGPIMYNWIPQGEKEQTFDAPLMLLPRFWSSAAQLNLEKTVEISEEAQTFALENFPSEAAWYAANCGGELSPP